MATADEGHGVWPYVLPYFAFLGSIELARRALPEDWAPLGLFLKPAVPGLLLVYFARRGAYPELRGASLAPGWRLLDAAVGIALAALWMAPYVWIEAIRPAGPGFDPEQLGPGRVGWALGLRLFGFALVTPFLEEIFIRGFVMRYADVFQSRGDFRRIPLARYTRVSFAATVVVFTIAHVPWEYWVAVPWVALTNLWFYYRRDLYAVIVAHAATNAAILTAAVLLDQRFTDATGAPISLWFFV
jgi:CAAX prenyl protease-like protein